MKIEHVDLMDKKNPNALSIVLGLAVEATFATSGFGDTYLTDKALEEIQKLDKEVTPWMISAPYQGEFSSTRHLYLMEVNFLDGTHQLLLAQSEWRAEPDDTLIFPLTPRNIRGAVLMGGEPIGPLMSFSLLQATHDLAQQGYDREAAKQETINHFALVQKVNPMLAAEIARRKSITDFDQAEEDYQDIQLILRRRENKQRAASQPKVA